MEDYRFIEIEEEFEDDEENEEDYDEGESDEELIALARDSNLIFTAGDEDDLYYDYDYDYQPGEEEDDELIPLARINSIEEEEEEEELEELHPMGIWASRVSNSIVHGRPLLDDSNHSQLSEGNSSNQKLNKGEIDGLICPICFEAWTSGGNHQICCLPCGHLYGLYCIKKWLQQSRGSGKCPQCNSLCTLKDIRVLYTTRFCVADEELQKRIRSLEAKCVDLERKVESLKPEELIEQVCNDPILLQRLRTALVESQQQQQVE